MQIPWRRAWQPSPVFLPGESPWTEVRGRLESIRSQRVRNDLVTEYMQLGFMRKGANKEIIFHTIILKFILKLINIWKSLKMNKQQINSDCLYQINRQHSLHRLRNQDFTYFDDTYINILICETRITAGGQHEELRPRQRS